MICSAPLSHFLFSHLSDIGCKPTPRPSKGRNIFQNSVPPPLFRLQISNFGREKSYIGFYFQFFVLLQITAIFSPPLPSSIFDDTYRQLLQHLSIRQFSPNNSFLPPSPFFPPFNLLSLRGPSKFHFMGPEKILARASLGEPIFWWPYFGVICWATVGVLPGIPVVGFRGFTLILWGLIR